MLNSTVAPWPAYDDEQIAAVAAVVRSGKVNYWTGEEARRFEEEFAAFAGCERAVALTNGTVALDLALRALSIGPGDEVIVTPRTFIASVSSVVNAGATPIFADVERDSGNISAATIAPHLSARTRAVIPVHLAGWPCAMSEILDLVAPRGISVIEDCAQAHGAAINGRSVGSFGAVGAWSFCQDKIMSTGGEGGMVTCHDEDLWQSMWSYKDHGKDWEAVYAPRQGSGFRWLHHSFGTNWRMLEVQAAIGRIQLNRMPEWHKRRAAIAARYAHALAPFENLVRAPMPPPGFTHGWYRFYAYVEEAALANGWSRDRIVDECTARGAPIFQGSCSEVYRERAFEGTGLRPDRPLPVAAELGATSLMLLTHPTLTDGDVSRIIDTLTQVLGDAMR